MNPEAGAIEGQARADVAAMMSAHPLGEVLAAIVFRLAGLLDSDLPAMAVAGVTRELRETLVELSRMAVSNDDLDEQLSRPSLPSPVRNPEES